MEGERRDVLRFSPGHCERFEGQDALRFEMDQARTHHVEQAQIPPLDHVSPADFETRRARRDEGRNERTNRATRERRRGGMRCVGISGRARHLPEHHER